MPDFPSSDDLFRVVRDAVLQKNSKLTAAIVEREGTDANVILSGAVAVGDELVDQLIAVDSGVYLDSSVGPVLDRYVFDRYSMVRKAAAAAEGDVLFSTTAINPASFVIPAGTQVQSPSGQSYLSTADVTFPLGTSGPVSVHVRSVLAGLDQQAAIGTLTVISGTIAGAPDDLTCTNAEATFGADDSETDAQLRNRARLFYTTASKGTLTAIEAGALAVPGVRTAKAIELLDKFGNPAKYVTLIITDAFTESLVIYNVVPPVYQAQANALQQTVFAALQTVRAAGIYVRVLVANVVLLPVRLALTYAAGVDTVQVAAEACAAVVNYTNNLGPGQQWTEVEAQQAVASTPGLFITGYEIVSPKGVVQPATLEVLRTSPQLVVAD